MAFLGAVPVDEVARAFTGALAAGPARTSPGAAEPTAAGLPQAEPTLAGLPGADPCAAGRPQPAAAPITLRIAGGGRFGSVIWAGLSGDVDRLAALREGVRGALAGFPIDERPFRPHLTLSYRSDRTVLEALEDYSGPSWQVTELALVHSENGEYRVVSSVPLGG